MILTAMLAGASPIVAYAVGRRRGFAKGARIARRIHRNNAALGIGEAPPSKVPARG